jgi:hypothetical protein
VRQKPSSLGPFRSICSRCLARYLTPQRSERATCWTRLIVLGVIFNLSYLTPRPLQRLLRKLGWRRMGRFWRLRRRKCSHTPHNDHTRSAPAQAQPHSPTAQPHSGHIRASTSAQPHSFCLPSIKNMFRVVNLNIFLEGVLSSSKRVLITVTDSRFLNEVATATATFSGAVTCLESWQLHNISTEEDEIDFNPYTTRWIDLNGLVEGACSITCKFVQDTMTSDVASIPDILNTSQLTTESVQPKSKKPMVQGCLSNMGFSKIVNNQLVTTPEPTSELNSCRTCGIVCGNAGALASHQLSHASASLSDP